MTDQNDFVKSILGRFGDVPKKFEPMSEYNPSGDCIEFLFSNEDYYGKRLDGWVTIYVGEDSGEIVGGLIKGVCHNLLKQFPGVNIEIEDSMHDVKIGLLLQGPLLKTDNRVVHKTYTRVIQMAQDANMTTNLQPC